MNAYILVFFLRILAIQQNDAVQEIVFAQVARGYNKTIIIRADSVIYDINNRIESHAMRTSKSTTKKQWKQVVNLVINLPLDSLNAWVSPTNKRTFDGALHSTITVETRTKKVTHSFDDLTPHSKAARLLQCIQKVGQSLK